MAARSLARCRLELCACSKGCHRLGISSTTICPSGHRPSRTLQSQRSFASAASADTKDMTQNPTKEIRYTSESYPSIQRNTSFGRLTAAHVRHFQSILPAPSSVIDGVTEDASDDLEPFNSDWMRKYRGQSRLVLKPKTVEQVSEIMKYCNQHSLAVVPQGGNSGLVGGSVPVFDEIILSLSAMNSIRSFDDVSGILVADAGVVMEAADHYVADRGHIFPLDLGAKGSCQLGGLVATNAGGLRFLRYGSLHGNVLGLEIVLPNGTIIRDLSKLRKNNTGYDLKQLLIGAEGTLGIVTGVSVQCPQRSKAVNVAFFGLKSYDAVQRAFREAKTQLSEILSAFEMMDQASQARVKQVTGRSFPLEAEHPFYCLIETSGSDGAHDSAKLEKFLEFVMEEEIVEDGVLAQDESQKQNLWKWREGVPEVLGHWGGVYKYDVSIPLSRLYDLVVDTRNHLADANLFDLEAQDSSQLPVVDVVGYGHMGDSNLHLNVAVRKYDKAVEKTLEPWVYEWIQKREGSISAEHGLGIAKKPFIQFSRDTDNLELMKSIKQLFDPKGIMNPYKYI